MSEFMFAEETRFLNDLWMAMGKFKVGVPEQYLMPPVIAGGYIRDSILGKGDTIRDVDIFVSVNNLDAAYQWLSMDQRPLWQVDENAYYTQDSPRYVHQAIQWQREFQAADSLIALYPKLLLETRKINLIALRWDYEIKATTDPKEIVSRFNVGLSQFALDVNQQVYFTPRARLDWITERITVLRESWGADGTMKAVNKLQAKYGWPAFFQDESQFSEEELRRREASAKENIFG